MTWSTSPPVVPPPPTGLFLDITPVVWGHHAEYLAVHLPMLWDSALAAPRHLRETAWRDRWLEPVCKDPALLWLTCSSLADTVVRHAPLLPSKHYLRVLDERGALDTLTVSAASVVGDRASQYVTASARAMLAHRPARQPWQVNAAMVRLLLDAGVTGQLTERPPVAVRQMPLLADRHDPDAPWGYRTRSAHEQLVTTEESD